MPVTHQPYANHRLFRHQLKAPAIEADYVLGTFAEADRTLRENWADPDCIFLFLRNPATAFEDPDVQASFTIRLKSYLQNPLHRQVRFLWVENPLEPLTQWRSHSLSVETDRDRSTISRLSYLDLRNYAFSIARGTLITLEDTETPKGFKLSQARDQPEAFELAVGYGAHRLHSLGPTVTLPMENDLAGCFQFDFHVQKQGTATDVFGYPDLAHLDIGFRLFIRDPDFPESGDDVYLSSHRYPLIDQHSDNDHGYPYYPERIAFNASLDPLYPLVPERTYLIFQSPEDRFFQAVGLPSAYRTNLGYSVHLKPVADQSRLQFALCPARLKATEQAQAPFYLVPVGDYEMVVPRYEKKVPPTPNLVAVANVIGGISGLEYIKVTTDPVVRLTFVPEQPAYARDYVSVNSLFRDLPAILNTYAQRQLPSDTTDLDMRIENREGEDTEEALGINDIDRQQILDIIRQDYFPPRYQFTAAQLDEYNNLEIVEDLIQWLRSALQSATSDLQPGHGSLADSATTSWVYVRSDDGAVYYAQPDQAPLYRAEASSRQFLDFLEVPSVGLPSQLTAKQQTDLLNATGYNSLAFPMLPYGNVDADALADIRQLEISLINNFRRGRIQQISQVTNHSTPLGQHPLVSFEPTLADQSDQVKTAELQEKIAAIGEILTSDIDVTIDQPTTNGNIFIDDKLKYKIIQENDPEAEAEALKTTESLMRLWWKWYCEIQNDQKLNQPLSDNQTTDGLSSDPEPSDSSPNSEEPDLWLISLAYLFYYLLWTGPELIMSFPGCSLNLAGEPDAEKAAVLKATLAPLHDFAEPTAQVVFDQNSQQWKITTDSQSAYKIQQENGKLNLYSIQQPVGTTPQGLIATYSYDFINIEQLQLMKDTENHSISFVSITHGSPLKAAFQSNQLFMVISDPDAVKQNFSQDVLSAIPAATTSLNIQNWIFELGTEYWKKQGTLLIFKFHDQALLELAEDPDLWSMADQFNIDKARASQSLVSLLKQAVEIGKSSDPKQRRKYEVLARAATQPNWTGILALNVHVPPGNLPDDLKALAAGIDANLFYAQYVGAEVTPVQSTGTDLVPLQSSLFGLIDYANPHLPLADASGYNFHVPVLSVVFKNSEITDFGAEILLIMDRLFDETTTLANSPDGKNILRLLGVAEEHNGRVTYSFGFSGANRFLLSGQALQEMEIIKAQFVTDPLPDPKPNPLLVKGRFLLWGHLRFAYRPDFDLLSFGATPGVTNETPSVPGAEPPKADYLSLSNLQVVMSFELNETTEVDPATKQEKPVTQVENRAFVFNPSQIAFDLKRSGWRQHSLYEKFPLKFSGFRVVKTDPQALEKSGFMPVKAPGKSVELGDTWYGLTFELNLGSAGALAGSAGLVVSILAAWVPEADGLYVGLKLPGASGGKREIVIQGLLKIAFKSIQFVVYPVKADQNLAEVPIDQERQVGYLLKIKNVMLKFFVLSFPPSGQTEFILFGDPRVDVEREKKLLGWYAGYAR